MVEKISEPNYPSGISRLLFRAPIWLYRHNLGWLMSGRLLELTHTGRISGQPRYVVLEVVMHDPATDTYYIAAAWGDKSDWVKNIQVNPKVHIKVGRRNLDRIAEQLTPEQGEEVILDYSHKHKSAMMSIGRFMGYKLDGSEGDFRELGRLLMMFALKPVDNGTAQ
ncbi:MAG: nitroreductase family deazaflavin-dependent oxidoreductase [Anaerolineales bacterium]